MSAAEFAGTLNQLVTVERWVASSDDLGGDAGTWVVEGRSWAEIASEPGRPADDGAALSVRQRFRVTMRENAAPGLQHRLVWNGRVLTILSVVRDPAETGRVRLVTEART